MNYDSFYDSVKSIGDLTFFNDGVDHTVLLPFVADIKKVNLIVEKEEIFLEGTPLEVEGKSIFIFDGGNIDIEFTKHAKSMFGALLAQNGDRGKLNIAKVGCPILDISEEDKKAIIDFVEISKKSLDSTVDDIIIKTSGHMDVQFNDTMIYLNEGITYFGKIFLVEERMKSISLERSDLVDNMCNKSDLDVFFNRFMEAVEVYYTALSTANLAQIKNNGN